jgi:hypothetical protein
MKINVDFNEFDRAFIDMNRADNFTYEGRLALFDWLIELEEGSGVETELDVIGLCCDFSQGTIEYFLEEYDLETFEDLKDRTVVMYVEAPQVEDINYWENKSIKDLPFDADEKDEKDEFFQTEIIIGVF